MLQLMYESLNSDWKKRLALEFEQKYMQDLANFLYQRQKAGKIIYPKFENIFRAFNLTHLHNIKVVILGQDPYHGKDQADGLSFSVPSFMKIPPSLKNIFKELNSDLGIIADNGNLDFWAKEGVFLLNSCLSVEEGAAGSHQKHGWEVFTDKVLSLISSECEAVSFILWGNAAIAKQKLLDEQKHLILTGAHPSPLSAHKDFFGKKYFSKTNEFLKSQNREGINWQLPNMEATLFDIQ